jgi:hypothetical protein
LIYVFLFKFKYSCLNLKTRHFFIARAPKKFKLRPPSPYKLVDDEADDDDDVVYIIHF